MAYCARCGVEVEAGVLACPLCALPVPRFDDEPDDGAAPRYPSDLLPPEPPSGHAVRMALWATLSALFLVSFLVVVAVNLIWTGGSLTWAGFAMASIGLAWAIMTLILLLFRWPWIVVVSSYPPVVGFLALVDVFSGGFEWFLPLGLPIATAFFIVPVVSLVLWMVWRDHGTNHLAVLLALVAMLCVGIDLMASRYLGDLELSWSIVVTAVLVPLSGFFFVHHYVLRRIPLLRRIFHM
jgi:hypothetical protein